MSKEQPTSINRERFAKAEEDAKILDERFAKVGSMSEAMAIGYQAQTVKNRQEGLKIKDEFEAYDIEDMRKQLSEAAVLGDADRIIELGQQMKSLQGQGEKPNENGVDMESIVKNDEARIDAVRTKIDGINIETAQAYVGEEDNKKAEQLVEDNNQKKLVKEYLDNLEREKKLLKDEKEAREKVYSLEKSNDGSYRSKEELKKARDSRQWISIQAEEASQSRQYIFKNIADKTKAKYLDENGEDKNNQEEYLKSYLTHLKNRKELSTKSREAADRVYSLEKSNDSNHPVVVAARKERELTGKELAKADNMRVAAFDKLSAKTRSEYLDKYGDDKNDQEVQIQKYLDHVIRYEELSEKNSNAQVSFDSALKVYSDRNHPFVVEAKNAWNAAGIELDNERQIGNNIFKNLTEETKDRRLNKNGTAKE